MDDKTKENLAGAAATGLATLGTVLLGDIATAQALATTLLMLFPSAVTLAFPIVFARKKRRAERWWKTLTTSVDSVSPDAVTRKIEDQAEQPYVHETIVTSIRTLLDAVDDSVVPALGVLAAEYIGDEKRPDLFFRGLCRVLCDISGDELEVLKALVYIVASDKELDDPVEMDYVVSLGAAPASEVICGVQCSRQMLDDDHGAFPAMLVSGRPELQRLFHLLKIHELAMDNPGGVLNTVSGPSVLRMKRETASHILAIFKDRPD